MSQKQKYNRLIRTTALDVLLERAIINL
jgi:hypothetical protein